MRHDAVFHDGKPITSKDVAFSIMTVKKHHPFKSMDRAIKKVDTPDPYTAIVRLKYPDPALLLSLSPALTPILPKHVYGKGKIESNPHNTKDVVGSGPFKLVKFVPGKVIVLKRFDKFFEKGKPYLNRIIMRINQNGTALLIAAQSGQIQMLPFVNSPATLKRAKRFKNLELYSKGYEAIGSQGWLEINTAKKPFNDKRVRQAMDYALDKKYIVNKLMDGFPTFSYGPIVSTNPLSSPDAVHKYPVNLDKARKLLDEAGLKPDKDGVRFKMTLNILPGPQSGKVIAGYVRSQFKKIGIKVTLKPSADFPSWAKTIATKSFDMTTDIVWNWGDPIIGVARMYKSSNIRPIVWTNTMSYRNKKVDKLLHEASREVNKTKRKKLYAQFEKQVTEDVPIIYIDQTGFYTLANKKVHSVVTSIWGPLSPMDNVYLK